MKSMETGRQDGGSDKNHAPFSVGKTGNISRKFLTIILKIFDKNFERLQKTYRRVKQISKGVFEITEEKNGFGKLKSGAGWIYLKKVERV